MNKYICANVNDYRSQKLVWPLSHHTFKGISLKYDSSVFGDSYSKDYFIPTCNELYYKCRVYERKPTVILVY